MTTMTLNIHNTNILESLKQVLSNMIGVEIMSVNNTADGWMKQVIFRLLLP